jgi:cytoskeletal protein RodZ
VGEFGNKFRKAREKKNLSLDDVSNVTKIGPRMLQAIEEEHFDRLPGGVFNKGFIRAYAKHLGLNDEAAINDYLACLRQSQIDALTDAKTDTQVDAKPGRQPERRPGQPRPARQQKPASLKSGKPNQTDSAKSAAKSQPPEQIEELPELQLPRAEHVRPRQKDFASNSGPEIPWRLVAVAAVVIVLGIILWIRRSHRTTANPGSSAAHTMQSAPPASTPASTNPSSTSPSTSSATSSSASNSATSPHPSNSTPQPQPRTPSAPKPHPPALAPAPAPPSATTADNASDESAAGNNNATLPAPQKSTLAPSENSTAPLTLAIRATETSWISVLADGQPVKHETLFAPANTSVRATREIIVKVGNAAGVTFLWNGQEIPATGAEAEVKTFVFDSTGMRDASATPPPAQ